MKQLPKDIKKMIAKVKTAEKAKIVQISKPTKLFDGCNIRFVGNDAIDDGAHGSEYIERGS